MATSTTAETPVAADPPRDCGRCPRLVALRRQWQAKEPDWHNAPVTTWLPPGGPNDVRLLIVGLAPGARGANRTGRPFTGDWSGELLFASLVRHGLAEHASGGRLDLQRTAITNAVRCVPPQNKPIAAEINNCRDYLSATIVLLHKLAVVLTLGRIAHDATIRALGGRVAAHPFGHGERAHANGLTILSSYHCSRYNVNTGRLTEEMLGAVVAEASRSLLVDRRS